MIVLGFCLGVGILIGLALMHRPRRRAIVSIVRTRRRR
jgi:hypothetical protein